MNHRLFFIASGVLFGAGLFVLSIYQSEFIAAEGGGIPVEVAVATVDIPFGQPVRAEWLATKVLPANYVESRHILASSMRDIIGLPLVQSVRAGESILQSDLSFLSNESRTLSAVVPEGERAYAVAATGTSSFGGLIRPGDRVDMLLTVGTAYGDEGWRNVVVLQNLLVVAVGRAIGGRGPSRNTSEGGSNITVLVSMQEAELIQESIGIGAVQFMLRNPNDEVELETTRALSMRDIYEDARREAFLLRRRRGTAIAQTTAPEVNEGVDR